MAGEPTIEKKSYSDEEAKRLLLKALRGHGGELTKADAVTLSGLPVPATEQALTDLLKEYRSHLAATESGELLYRFDPSFERRDAVPLREKLAKLGRAAWRGFTFLFKISIVTTLAVYFLIFLAMMLALIFARRSDDRDHDGGGLDIGWPIFWMWGWGPDDTSYARRRRRAPGKPLYKKVFEFVFGPPKPAADPLADEKDILAYIRKNRGRIAAVDLVALMGWDFARAEEEATRLMADYGGEPEVTDDGVVVYVFKDIRRTAQESGAEGREPRRAWQRLETRPPITGNTPGTNVAISLFNGFNLLAPLWIVPAFEARLAAPLGHEFLLQTYPMLFSLMVFGVPLGRWIVENLRDHGRQTRNARRTFLRRLIENRGAPLPPQQIAPDAEAAKVLDRSLVPLGGDVTTDEAGQMRYAFPRIREELDAVARVRAQASSAETEAGSVIFSSDDQPKH